MKLTAAGTPILWKERTEGPEQIKTGAGWVITLENATMSVENYALIIGFKTSEAEKAWRCWNGWKAGKTMSR
jgi:hypothetical protein